MELYLLIVLPIFASLLLYLFPSRVSTWLSVLVYAGVLAVTVDLFRRTRFLGQTVSTRTSDGFLGITLYCDLTASIFLMLVAFLFLCIFLYTHLPGQIDRLYSFLFTVLEGLVMLIFLSRDLFNVYVAVEVATIVCAVLIMFKRESRSIYDGLVYLLTNITGMLFFLLGTGMLYRQLGVLDFDGISAAMSGRDVRELALPCALVMTGACMKCALLPMHFWLPLAHGTPGAPTAISAVLSGVYVKSGVYLFLRMKELFGPVLPDESFFFWLGIATALAGIVMAVCQSDIKLILAYHTVSQIGLIIAGLCSGVGYGQVGAMLHIINHALFKSLLFLAAGILISAYGTRNIYHIRGVMKSIPLVGVAVAAGILGITGAPFFNGSISKYFLSKGGGTIADAVFLLVNFGTILSFVKFGQVLLGEKRAVSHRPGIFAGAVLALMSALCLLTGVFAGPFVELLFGFSLEIGWRSYLVKCLVWAASFILAWMLYRRVISRSARLRAGIDFSIGFNSIVLCIGGGFTILLIACFI